jgi:hypothetical protein
MVMDIFTDPSLSSSLKRRVDFMNHALNVIVLIYYVLLIVYIRDIVHLALKCFKYVPINIFNLLKNPRDEIHLDSADSSVVLV